ncbi:AsnC family transcriptional regulator [Micromonospora sp. NPDC050187]|uniref:AsnC family transcriptional regulator n=1 Tax=Micromonospora sp. NPDC050187 TaxID=3364277 RepID=UPI003792B4A3
MDWALLHELRRDARPSFDEPSRRVHLPPPTVADRIRCILRDPEVDTWPEVLEIHQVAADTRSACAPNNACCRHITGDLSPLWGIPVNRTNHRSSSIGSIAGCRDHPVVRRAA